MNWKAPVYVSAIYLSDLECQYEEQYVGVKYALLLDWFYLFIYFI